VPDESGLFHLPFSTGFKHWKKRAVQPLNFLHFWAIAHFFIGFKPISSMVPEETKAGPSKDQAANKKLLKIEDTEGGGNGP
jgi:hypothetical protein